MPDDALVDTDVASTLHRAQLFTERAPAAVVTAIHDRNLFVSVVTLGEALFGATRRKWSARRTTRLRDFYAARFAVVSVDSEVAVEYARLRSATEASDALSPPTTSGSRRPPPPTAYRSSPSTGGTSSLSRCMD